MLLWLILGCSSGNDEALKTTESQQSSEASATPSKNGAVNVQGQPRRSSGQQIPPQQIANQQGQPKHNGSNGRQGPLGPPPQGQMGAANGPQGSPPMGQPTNGQVQQPEPFHAEVTFDWTAEPTLLKEPTSIIWISLDTVHAKRMSIYGDRHKFQTWKRLPNGPSLSIKPLAIFRRRLCRTGR